MQPYNYPYLDPNANPSSRQRHPQNSNSGAVFTWLDDVFAEQNAYGLDPEVYSDRTSRRTANPYPIASSSHPHPPHPHVVAYQQQQQQQAAFYQQQQQAAFYQRQAALHQGPAGVPQQQQQPYPPYYGQHPHDAAAQDDDHVSYTSSSPHASEHDNTDCAGELPRKRTKLPLASNQPLTVEGRPRERVFVACDRCRVRKLRCDGAKPACYECGRVGETCRYDAVPKRRGPDLSQRVRSPNGTRATDTRKSQRGRAGSSSSAGYQA